MEKLLYKLSPDGRVSRLTLTTDPALDWGRYAVKQLSLMPLFQEWRMNGVPVDGCLKPTPGVESMTRREALDDPDIFFPEQLHELEAEGKRRWEEANKNALKHRFYNIIMKDASNAVLKQVCSCQSAEDTILVSIALNAVSNKAARVHYDIDQSPDVRANRPTYHVIETDDNGQSAHLVANYCLFDDAEHIAEALNMYVRTRSREDRTFEVVTEQKWNKIWRFPKKMTNKSIINNMEMNGKRIKYLLVTAEHIVCPEESFTSNLRGDDGQEVLPGLDSAKARWRVTIDLQSGQIQDWPKDVHASISFKVRDECSIVLQDANGAGLATYEGYVPVILSPADEGYGDYMFMRVNQNGFIEDWDPELIEDIMEDIEVLVSPNAENENNDTEADIAPLDIVRHKETGKTGVVMSGDGDYAVVAWLGGGRSESGAGELSRVCSLAEAVETVKNTLSNYTMMI